ncbi:MAG: hypothetical protein M0D53_12090 [Flavobacterium sp. JAD_PAG50586_2]|nr:MAG: hypothetical protein M0D53_12090 [Flavobacterium sp. JAD_PAG50586_2]
MRKLKLFCSTLLLGTMLLNAVPAAADPPPNGVYAFTDPATGDRMVWNSQTNMYEKRTIFHFPLPEQK